MTLKLQQSDVALPAEDRRSKKLAALNERIVRGIYEIRSQQIAEKLVRTMLTVTESERDRS